MEVAILLTTYNSSRFLDDLLQSLLRQTFHQWNLYVRDDRSEDGTLELIERYARSDDRVHVLDDGEKRGVMNGFMWLLRQVEADYYMFCDHDDVWKDNKIEVTLERMLAFQRADVPIVVHTDLTVVDSDLSCIAPSFWASQHFKEQDFSDKYFHLAYNNVTGCTMMINRLAKSVSLPVHACARMHDSWIVASVLWHGGQIVSVNVPTILYRQHGRNTVGVHELPGIWNKLRRLKRLVEKTNRQCEVARYISGISRWCFWAIKMYYMIRIYCRNGR